MNRWKSNFRTLKSYTSSYLYIYYNNIKIQSDSILCYNSKRRSKGILKTAVIMCPILRIALWHLPKCSCKAYNMWLWSKYMYKIKRQVLTLLYYNRSECAMFTILTIISELLQSIIVIYQNSNIIRVVVALMPFTHLIVHYK